MDIVSVIMPSYNASRFIEQAIDSVLQQSYQSIELIIIDDCSTDNSKEIIKELAEKHPKIKPVYLQENSGAAVARNKGIELAVGKYIAFLDTDDVWLPNKIEKQVEFMKDNNLPFCHSNYQLIDTEGHITERKGKFKNPLTYSDMLKSNFIGCLTAIYDSDILGKMYMPLIRKRQDYGLWLNILKKVDVAQGIETPLALYRMNNDSISSNKIEMLYWNWKLFYKVEKIGFFRSLRSLLFNIFNKLFN